MGDFKILYIHDGNVDEFQAMVGTNIACGLLNAVPKDAIEAFLKAQEAFALDPIHVSPSNITFFSHDQEVDQLPSIDAIDQQRTLIAVKQDDGKLHFYLDPLPDMGYDIAIFYQLPDQNWVLAHCRSIEERDYLAQLLIWHEQPLRIVEANDGTKILVRLFYDHPSMPDIHTALAVPMYRWDINGKVSAINIPEDYPAEEPMLYSKWEAAFAKDHGGLKSVTVVQRAEECSDFIEDRYRFCIDRTINTYKQPEGLSDFKTYLPDPEYRALSQNVWLTGEYLQRRKDGHPLPFDPKTSILTPLVAWAHQAADPMAGGQRPVPPSPTIAGSTPKVGS